MAPTFIVVNELGEGDVSARLQVPPPPGHRQLRSRRGDDPALDGAQHVRAELGDAVMGGCVGADLTEQIVPRVAFESCDATRHHVTAGQ